MMRAERKKLTGFGVGLTLAVAALGTGLIAACSDTPKASTQGATNQVPAGGCATPQTGCPCPSVGLTVPCGKTVSNTDGFLYCYEGSRTCLANSVYGDCSDGEIKTRSLSGGLHTNAVGAYSSCSGEIQGDLKVCDNGKKKGDFCIVDGDCGPGYKICTGGTDTTTTCKDNADCLSSCGSFNGKCNGGTTPNIGCNVDGDCAGAGATCNIPGGGNTCTTYPGLCDSTDPNVDGQACVTNADCSGGNCLLPKFGTCIGGSKAGKKCKVTKHCKGGGTCSIDVAPSDGGPSDGGTGDIDPCDPYCHVRTDTPTGIPGITAPFTLSPTGGLTILEGAPPCTATLKGTIYDPRGNNPIPQVMVYLPTTAVSAVPTGPGCDTCASLATGSPSNIAVTDEFGNFTMSNVPGDQILTVVVQSGRWRKVVNTLPMIGCGVTKTLGVDYGVATDRNLPTKQSATTNIPHIGLATASGDHLECLLRRVGVDDTEFTNDSGTGRVHLYKRNGMDIGSIQPATNLWDSPAKLATYDFVITPCDLQHSYASMAAQNGPQTTSPIQTTGTATEAANLKAYVNAGGRLFATHWFAHSWVYGGWGSDPSPPMQEEWGKNVDDDNEPGSFPYTVDTSTPDGLMLKKWGEGPAISAVSGGLITFNSWRHLTKTVNTAKGAVQLSYGDSNTSVGSFTAHSRNSSVWGGPHVNMYSFTTPWPSNTNTACGKVVVSQSHVLESSTGNNFPGNCPDPTVAMSPQEKAFEFLLFNATACNGATPTPAPTPPATNVTFTQDFTGVCGPGEHVEWTLFQWQATTPTAGSGDGGADAAPIDAGDGGTGSSIVFKASTATTTAGLAAAPGDPGVVDIGTAHNSNAVTAKGWTFDTYGGDPMMPHTVNKRLKEAVPQQASQDNLRVFMTFNTSVGAIPILNTWRMLYDCKPAE